MAQFRLNSFLDIGTSGVHISTSWRVTKDLAGLLVIDQSLTDVDNLLTWNSPLADGSGGHYADLDIMYLWVRIHMENTSSDWMMVNTNNQNDQTYNIVKNGVIIDTVNSLIAGIQ